MRYPLALKVLAVALLGLLLMIPLLMMQDLVRERMSRNAEARAGIAQGWGGEQVVSGPYLAVPWQRVWSETVREEVDGTERERRVTRREERMQRLPLASLDWQVAVTSTEKRRGIHVARLYEARLVARGRLAVPPGFGIHVPPGDGTAVVGTPRLVVGIADAHGIRAAGPLELDGASTPFEPGAGDPALAGGIHAPLPALAAEAPREMELGFSLTLAGSEHLGIVPLADDTRVQMQADWPHPSFGGVFLPATSDIRDGGFDAAWRISGFAVQAEERLRACSWRGHCASLVQQSLDVWLVEPVGLYQQLDRASKYGFLFVGLSFAAFLLFELLRRLAIHPVQYTLVGLALAMFFLLLTALSEHVGFGPAYLVAALACVGLITIYLVRVLASRRAGTAFGAALGSLYAVLYAMLGAEDYALLAGASLLFVLLGGVMLATRRVDWYALTRRPREAPPVAPAPATP